MITPVQWLRRHDPGFVALRRAARTAVVMPAMFALGEQVIGNPTLATFAAFGSFALLLMVEFGGPMRDRIRDQLALAVAGAVFICLGTLASRSPWLAAITMAVLGFAVLFAGVISSVLAGASTALLLSIILSVSLVGPASSIPDRLGGWALAAGASLIAITLLWPAPTNDPLRDPAAAACRALAVRLRAEVARHIGPQPPTDQQYAAAVTGGQQAVTGLRRTFLATPYRPTGLSTSARALVRLVDEISWLGAVIDQAAPAPSTTPATTAPPTATPPTATPLAAVYTVKAAAAEVLDRGADLLIDPRAAPQPLRTALTDLLARLGALEQAASAHLPVHRAGTQPGAAEVLSSLDPTFRAQELSYAVSQIGRNIDYAVAARRRGWLAQLLGRRPRGLPSTLSAAGQRAAAHLDVHSVWLHNSLRGALGLGVAVLVADEASVQHSFWVVLGALSVLRSNALSTGQTVLRAVAGTLLGFILGGLLLWAIGTQTTVLWIILPFAVLLAGVAPAAISFTAGQAAFTLTIVILFNIIQPVGWRVGLLRVEDVAIGCAVSLLVGLLAWPRGAGAALGRALSGAYSSAAGYLAAAVDYGMLRCRGGPALHPAPTDAAANAAAGARRLDDAYRGYLAERGSKAVSLAEVTGLLSGVVALRLAADAVLDLWHRDDCGPTGDRGAARARLRSAADQLQAWYGEFAGALVGAGTVPVPEDRDVAADGRLIDAVRRDLSSPDGTATDTAVRMIWTGDHLDAARRLEHLLTAPAQLTARRGALRRASLRGMGKLAGSARPGRLVS